MIRHERYVIHHSILPVPESYRQQLRADLEYLRDEGSRSESYGARSAAEPSYLSRSEACVHKGRI